MFKNYLKISFRHLIKHKSLSLINIIGLAVGMACCLLILLYVQNERSYDTFHENADRIYRVTREWFNADGTSNLHLGHVAAPFAPLLENDFSEIVDSVRLLNVGDALVSRSDKHFEENRIFFAEDSLFNIFSFKFLEGDPQTALKDPFAVVLTQSTAQKYFGQKNPMGQNLIFNNVVQAKVNGIIEDVPENSHVHFDILVSFATVRQYYGERELQNFGSNNYATYLLLPEGYPISRLKERISAFLDKHLGPEASKRNMLHFQKLTRIHLHSHLDSELEPNGDIAIITILTAVAFFILVIACINFMNISTSRSEIRAREVSLRKVVGARKNQLIIQFLGESLFMACLSLVAALILVVLFLPAFGRFVDRELSLIILIHPAQLSGLLILTLLVGILAGSYPAFFLSSFKPVQGMKGSRGGAPRGTLFRKVLVVFQFSVSIMLIIGVITVYQQLQFSRNKKLGFNKEQIVVLPSSRDIIRSFGTLRNELLKNPNIINVSGSRRVPSGRLLDSSGARVFRGENAEPVDFRIAFVCTDYEFIKTYGMKLAAGRDFSREHSTDLREAFILNETAVEKIGWNAEEAVGRPFQYGNRRGQIIGVVEDFHFESLHQPISPMVFFMRPSDYRRISVRIRPENIPATLAFLEKTWQIYRPHYPFSYFFIDERFDQLYRAEEKLARIFGYFSLLAVFIACLGLFGLASFLAERKTKEIGIRKTLGASVTGLAILLSKNFAGSVLLANLFAWPLAFYGMTRWLQNFAYRISLNVFIFILAASVSLAIALLSVSYQAVKAALANPVDSLRYE
ncbi:MAG: ABC transporter permease [Candidatus Aminicenantes bacterium]|nr:ABC transporter permease [Candidatus Aminicenantes bacterium]